MKSIQLNDVVDCTYYKHFTWVKKKIREFDIAVTREHKNESKMRKSKIYCKWDTEPFTQFLSHKEENYRCGLAKKKGLHSDSCV